jgi:hypothetical protein
MMNLKTQCPVQKQQNVIDSIKRRASRGKLQVKKNRDFIKEA